MHVSLQGDCNVTDTCIDLKPHHSIVRLSDRHSVIPYWTIIFDKHPRKLEEGAVSGDEIASKGRIG